MLENAIGVCPNVQVVAKAHNTHMDKKQALRSEAQANQALASTVSRTYVGKNFATPAPKRSAKVKPSLFVRLFKKG